jgi:hypothetical protein
MHFFNEIIESLHKATGFQLSFVSPSKGGSGPGTLEHHSSGHFVHLKRGKHVEAFSESPLSEPPSLRVARLCASYLMKGMFERISAMMSWLSE